MYPYLYPYVYLALCRAFLPFVPQHDTTLHLHLHLLPLTSHILHLTSYNSRLLSERETVFTLLLHCDFIQERSEEDIDKDTGYR